MTTSPIKRPLLLALLSIGLACGIGYAVANKNIRGDLTRAFPEPSALEVENDGPILSPNEPFPYWVGDPDYRSMTTVDATLRQASDMTGYRTRLLYWLADRRGTGYGMLPEIAVTSATEDNLMDLHGLVCRSRHNDGGLNIDQVKLTANAPEVRDITISNWDGDRPRDDFHAVKTIVTEAAFSVTWCVKPW